MPTFCAATPSSTKPLRQLTIKLPPARAGQLQTLAEVWNVSVADAVGVMLRQQIDAGVLSADIPGVTCARERDGVVFGFDGGAPVNLSLSGARNVATMIRARAGLSDLLVATLGFVGTSQTNFGLQPVEIERRGTGVNVRVNAVKKSFSLSLAGELADLIDRISADPIDHHRI